MSQPTQPPGPAGQPTQQLPPPPPPSGGGPNPALVAGIVFVVVALVVAVLVWHSERNEDGGDTTKRPPESAMAFAAPGSPYGEDLARTIDDLNAYWAEEMPQIYGREYQELAHGTIPYDEAQPPPNCGIQQLTYEKMKNNAFFCPPQPIPSDKSDPASGDYIAYDVGSLFPKLAEVFGASGIAAVMAHEWGHAIQYRGGAVGQTIELELQADCFSGSWIGRTARYDSELLYATPQDVDRAMAALLFFRDPPGTNPANPSAHGNGFDRVVAFEDGLRNGAAACVDYPGTVQYTESTYDTGWEVLTGGNAPLNSVIASSFSALDLFWRAEFDAAFDSRHEYSAVANLTPFSGAAPACPSGPVPEPAEAADLAYYCADDDTVGWGTDPDAIPVLYGKLGDGSVVGVLADRWGFGMRSKAGEDLTGVDTALHVDCTTGAFLYAAYRGNLGNYKLSPGDLDEAIAGALASSLVAGFADDRGNGFERVGAISTGFNQGVAACSTM